MKKIPTSLRNSGAYTSPGTPEYGEVGGIQKGCSSERIPLPTRSGRRHISATALMPFNSGRAFPSKWDDAERWITSPVSVYGACKALVVQPQGKPKSRSGPLGASRVMYLPAYSPAVAALEGGGLRNFVTGSPFTTGVLLADGLSIQYSGGIGAPFKGENCMAPSGSLPGYSNLLRESSLPSSQDEKFDDQEEAETTVPHVSQRDMGTQMSLDSSPSLSPIGKSSLSVSPTSIQQSLQLLASHTTTMEVRDVQVDKGATMARQYKKHGLRLPKSGSPDVDDLVSSWDIAEAATSASKLQREEAKITAWENLQKAKAEAAIQKLEMKLEKEKSASMDKILGKLRDAEMKAQEMRSIISETHAHQCSLTPQRFSSLRQYMKILSLSSCFTGHVQ